MLIGIAWGVVIINNVYVARQPIFDREQKVFAYELLYRSGSDNFFSSFNGDRATIEVIANSILLIGLNTLTRGRKAFINFTRNLLIKEFITSLPSESVVIEILENIEPDENLINACKKLKKLGYLLALDDFIYDNRYEPLIELADIIKVDFKKTDMDKQKALINKIGSQKIKFLAEKVETREDFLSALDMGYSYFQGYFFSKPVIVRGKEIPSYKLNYFQLLKDIHKPDFDFDHVENLFKRDVSLSFKLLKFINSAAFFFRTEISSIKQALVLLGQKGLIKWLSLLTLKNIGEDKPDELLIAAISRAMFCESIAIKAGLKEHSSDLFLMGMFSLIDAFLDQPLSSILTELPISKEIKNTLLGEKSKFSDIYSLVLFYERGDFENLYEVAAKLNLNKEDILKIYVNSLELANNLYL